MHAALRALLAELRAQRRFVPAEYARAKCALLSAYLARGPMCAAVVGVSGGVDSAVTLALLEHARSQSHNSPLKRVVAALVPMPAREGATRQEEATRLGRLVAARFRAEIALVDLSHALDATRCATEGSLGAKGTAWASGQLVSYLRTPALYHLTALLAEQGSPAVLVGTTNRDEGAYLGFFGKASDGMVDVQLVSDLHKSEVYALGALLGVPDEVLRAEPTGDTFDGRVDEAMIGAPYDFVELYARARERFGERFFDAWRRSERVPAEARDECLRYERAVETLHRQNEHKYWGASPAVHLDVYPRGVAGGWEVAIPVFPAANAPGEETRARWVAPFSLGRAAVERVREGTSAWLGETRSVTRPGGVATECALLSEAECAGLLEELARAERVPVGLDGRRAGFDPSRDPTGSFRATAYSEALAAYLWQRLATVLPAIEHREHDASARFAGRGVWRAVGLNPLFRALWYEPGGALVAHFDEGYDPGDGRHFTLQSVLLSLTDGGATRLLFDPSRGLPPDERDFSDGGLAHEGDVLERVASRAGRALCFDHRTLHDAEAWAGSAGRAARVLLRTDVVYAWCGHERLARGEGVTTEPQRALGVRAGASRAEVDAAYRGFDPSLRPAWKLLRDPFYRDFSSVSEAEAAGFFDDGGALGALDGDDPRASPAWLCTPVHKAHARLDALRAHEHAEHAPRSLVVLVSTGAFCPPHRGHTGMMERARETLERDGHAVLAGYLSPSHDAYVGPKCGASARDAATRVALCEAAVRESDWLELDPWEALHTSAAVNFTEVVHRLERYLARNLRCARPVHVAYVFGGDNARFALAFARRGRAVCVPRPGYEAEFDRVRALRALAGVSRVRFASRPAVEAPASSSSVREGDAVMLDAGVRALWERRETHARRGLSLRDEGAWALDPWLAGRDAAPLLRAYEAFREGICSLVARYARLTGVRSLREERAALAVEARGARVLSLDPCVPGDHALRVSRAFALTSGAQRAHLVARPGAPSIEAQLEAMPAGAYLLYDDDSATGGTLRRVRALLPARCSITAVHTALGDQSAEGCDLRDFLPGAREGGLVVALPGAEGELARAPYVLPFVRPASRLGIDPRAERAFSHAVWLLAERFFAAVSPPVRVEECAPAFRALARHVGFEGERTLDSFCAWHRERLALDH